MAGCSAFTLAVIASVVSTSSAFVCDQETLQITAYPLLRADAARIVKKLKALPELSGDVEIASDDASNTVYLRAQPEKIEQVKKILVRLDVGVPSYLTVVSLQHADPARTAKRLKAILTLVAFFGDDDLPILVIGDERGKTVLISAREELMQLARVIARWLDVKGK